MYWDNGAQIVPPHDKGIAQAIEENLEPWPQAWDTEEALSSPLLKDPYQDIHQQYFKAIQQHCHHRYDSSPATLLNPGSESQQLLLPNLYSCRDIKRVVGKFKELDLSDK